MGVPEIDPREVAELGASGAVLVLDVREPEEWAAGRIAGATHLPLGELGARYQELPKDRRIVAVCRSGARSGQATSALNGAGYDVVNMRGGMKAWQAAGLPIDPPGGVVV
ncbi:MAG: rhodanese-like domain-containing protein [Thermoleophilia bacterium]